MIENLAIEPTVQKGHADCGIAALSMLLGKPYAEVSERAMRLAPTVHRKGLWMRQLQQIAQSFGRKLKKLTRDDDATGILVIRLRGGARHFVVLFQGVAINPGDGLVWDLDALMAKLKGREVAFLG